MRIGFISGDVFELTRTRKGVSVPDYPVQGYLLGRWLQAGHEVVLLTRVASNVEVAPRSSFTYAPGDDPNTHKLDMLFTDRIGTAGSEYVDAMRQVQQYEGPLIYHGYVPYPGWAPPFLDLPPLQTNKRWLILNRSSDPRVAYIMMTGERERVPAWAPVKYATWEPFLMKNYPWFGDMPQLFSVGGRRFCQGYYGRVPKGEKKAQQVLRWLNHGDWSKVVYGPPASTRWLAEATGAEDGGRIEHRFLPRALAKFDFTVQASIDRFSGQGQLNYTPHRVVECAIAGVFQLFDYSMGLKGLEPWRVQRIQELDGWMPTIRSAKDLRTEVALQRAVILTPEREPSAVLVTLENLMEAHRRNEL